MSSYFLPEHFSETVLKPESRRWYNLLGIEVPADSFVCCLIAGRMMQTMRSPRQRTHQNQNGEVIHEGNVQFPKTDGRWARFEQRVVIKFLFISGPEAKQFTPSWRSAEVLLHIR
jgi:hypothetical protein